MLSSWNLAQSFQGCLIVAHKPELRSHAQTQIFGRIGSSCAKFPIMFNSCAQKQSSWETMDGVENTSPNYEFVHTLNTGISPWVLPGSGPWHDVPRNSQSFGARFHQTLHSCANSSPRARRCFREKVWCERKVSGKHLKDALKNTSLIMQGLRKVFENV